MSNPKLYTLIIDYNGGTYVTQAIASNTDIAPSECIKNWDISDIQSEINENDKNEILEQLESEKFTLIKELKKAWCGSVSLKKGLILMNLVETNNAT